MKRDAFNLTLISAIIFLFASTLSAGELYYYSNGRKITLTEDNSAQTFIDLTKKESVKSLSDVRVLNSHRNIFTIEKASKQRLEALSKKGTLYPAYKIGGKARVFLSGMMFIKIPGQNLLILLTELRSKLCLHNPNIFPEFDLKLKKLRLILFIFLSVKGISECPKQCAFMRSGTALAV